MVRVFVLDMRGKGPWFRPAGWVRVLGLGVQGEGPRFKCAGEVRLGLIYNIFSVYKTRNQQVCLILGQLIGSYCKETLQYILNKYFNCLLDWIGWGN